MSCCIEIFLQSDTVAAIFFAACFYVAIIQGRCLFFWKARRHQRRLDKLRTSDTVMIVRHCQ